MPEEQSDFDFVESIYSGGLASKGDADGIETLSIPERNVLLAWWAKGEIDNGGFAQLYVHPVDIDAVITACADIGLQEFADACVSSKRKFSQGQPPADLQERRNIVDRMTAEPQSADVWNDEDKVVWGLGDQFDQAVASYIRSNSRHFAAYSR